MTDERGAPIRVAIVNDYEVVVRGLAAMLEPFSDRVVISELEAGGIPDDQADIALFDTFAGRRHALERIDEMMRDRDIGKIVIYTWDLPEGFSEDLANRSVDAVIMKSAAGAQLVEALERVHRGEPVGLSGDPALADRATLTERETEVLALLGRGLSNGEIAHELYLSVDTIKTHVRKLFAKLQVTNRTQAALVAVDRGLTAGH